MVRADKIIGIAMDKAAVSYMLLSVEACDVVSFSIIPNTTNDKFKLTCETDVGYNDIAEE